jgi:hypothetical protein
MINKRHTIQKLFLGFSLVISVSITSCSAQNSKNESLIGYNLNKPDILQVIPVAVPS